MLNKDVFANRLKSLRENRGISTRNLAAAIGLKSHGAIAQFEKGTSLPAIDTLVKLAEYFEVTLDYLVGVSEISSPSTPAGYDTTKPKETATNIISNERQESSDEPVHKTEELIAGLDEESMAELHKFIRYLHARQTLDGDDEISCGLDISDELKEAR